MKYLSALAAVAALSLCSVAYAQDVSVSASVSVSVDPSSTLSSLSSELSSGVSSVSSELSSAVSSASSELSSELSSSTSMSSGEEMTCDNLDASTVNVAMLAPGDLAAITSVTIFAVDDCSSLGDLAAMDAGAIATLTTNPQVQAALNAQGEFGGEITGYTLSDTSLTVYVRDRD